MDKIKNAIPVGAEIYKLENVGYKKLKVYFKDHFSDAYNSSFKKSITIDGSYDIDMISDELIGYVRPTKDYLERPKRLSELLPFDDIEGAKNYLTYYKLLGKEQLTSEFVENKFKAQRLILDKGNSKDTYTYIIHDYIFIEIKKDRNFVNNLETKLIADEITVKDFLFYVDLFNKKVKLYNEMNQEYGFMDFPLYSIKNPIVKTIVRSEKND